MLNSSNSSRLADEKLIEKEQELQYLRNELNYLENQLDLFFDNSPDMMYEIDFRGPKFLRVNEALCKKLGYTREEILIKNPMDFLDDKSKKIFQERINKSLSGEKLPEWIEYTGYTKDGHKLIGELNIKFKFEKGIPVGGMVIAHDITDHRKSEILYKSILDNSVDAPYRRNLLTNSYDYFGPTIELISGFSVEEVLNMGPKGILERVHPDDVSRVMVEKMDLESSVSQGTVEYRFLCNDDTYKWISDHFKIIYDEYDVPIFREGIVRDINEQNKAEKELKQSEARFRSVLNNSPDVIYRFNLQSGKYEYMSPSIKTLGFEPEELMTMSNDEVLSRVHPDDRPDLTAILSEINDLGVGSCEYRFKGNDGKYRWWSNKLVIIKDFKNQPLYRDGFVRDITDLKKAEKKLQDERDLLQNIMNGAKNYHLVYLDRNFNFVRVNEAYANTCGYHPEEMIGKNHFDLYPNEENESIFKYVRDTGKSVEYHDKPFEFPDQPERGITYWDWTLIPIKSENEVVGLIFSLFETTERKEAELHIQEMLENEQYLTKELQVSNEKLKNSTLRLNQAQRIGKIGSWEWDLKTDKVWWSDETYQIFEVTPDDFTPSFESNGEFIHPDDFALYVKEFERSIETGESFDFDVRLLLKDGILKFCNLKGRIIYDDLNQPLKFPGTIIDITDRKKAEKELKELIKKLEVSNRELEQFAYVASHDLQEPLRMVSSFTQLLEKRYKDSLDDDADDYIDFIVEGANRMKDLIDDLLAFSQINTEAKPFQPINMVESVNEIVSYLKPTIEETNAEITHGSLPNIMGDPSQIRQLFQNLISNAIKFRGEEPPKIHISAEKSGKEWLISVIDNGVGIDLEHQDQIFKIFNRLHTREEYPGTGIGLAICKRIVNRHGGKIWVESNPLKGSTFYFTLPQE